MVMAGIRGEAPSEQLDGNGSGTEREQTVSSILQNVWFASFVGWAGGLHDADQVLADTDKAAHLLFAK